MQNRYVGDVGDFGKFGMLRQVARTGLTIGVNWYLTRDESHNADGKHIGYLNQPQFYGYDDVLYLGLKQMVEEGRRDVRSVQSSGLLPAGTLFYDALLDFSGEPVFWKRMDIRRRWHQKALEVLEHSDVVFSGPG